MIKETPIENVITVFEGSKDPEDVFIDLILNKHAENIKAKNNKSAQTYSTPSDLSLSA